MAVGQINLYLLGKGSGKTEKNLELIFEKVNKPTKSFHLGISVKDSDKVINDIMSLLGYGL